jgi:hypothetical protein
MFRDEKPIRFKVKIESGGDDAWLIAVDGKKRPDTDCQWLIHAYTHRSLQPGDEAIMTIIKVSKRNKIIDRALAHVGKKTREMYHLKRKVRLAQDHNH